MLDRIRGAFPEEAEYYRVMFLDGYRENMKFGAYVVRRKVNHSSEDEDIHIKSEFLSVNNKEELIQDIWEKTFLKASLRHQVYNDERHDTFCNLAAKITRVMVKEGAVEKKAVESQKEP